MKVCEDNTYRIPPVKFRSCMSCPEKWSFCQAVVNSADLPTLGVTDHLRDNQSIWLKGLDFLYKHEDKSPKDPVGESSIVYVEAVESPCHVVHSLTLNHTRQNR